MHSLAWLIEFSLAAPECLIDLLIFCFVHSLKPLKIPQSFSSHPSREKTMLSQEFVARCI